MKFKKFVECSSCKTLHFHATQGFRMMLLNDPGDGVYFECSCGSTITVKFEQVRLDESMSPRLLQFHSYSTHPWLKHAYWELTPKELAICEQLIREYEHLSEEDFERIVTEFFTRGKKPDELLAMMSLLLSVVS